MLGFNIFQQLYYIQHRFRVSEMSDYITAVKLYPAVLAFASRVACIGQGPHAPLLQSHVKMTKMTLMTKTSYAFLFVIFVIIVI